MSDDALRKKWLSIQPHLDEAGRRAWCGAEAIALGRGGVVAVHRATDVALSTIGKGKREILNGVVRDPNRQRAVGAGRPRLEDQDPGLIGALEGLIEAGTRGDPESPLKWTLKSTRGLAAELTAQGHKCSAPKVGELLASLGYSLQGTSKTIEGTAHPDRNAQFELIAKLTKASIANGTPAISVDTKKKELIGQFANGGREWRAKGKPVEVLVHEFPDNGQGKAIPYGVYDIAKNRGWVNVGVDHDTPKFAVRSIETWWDSPLGSAAYPEAKELFITADAGGSNSYRFKAFKAELQRFSDERRLVIHMSHYPPGTSKWNKIEHRMFCHITRNWRGEPLASYETIIGLISSTRTTTGLIIGASLDERAYPKGATVSKRELAALLIEGNAFHPEWNYTIRPRATASTPNDDDTLPDDDVIYGRRRPRSWWLEMVRKQRQSGRSEKQFCAGRAFNYATFVWWRRRFSRDGLLKRPDKS